MIDISDKKPTLREAVVEGKIITKPQVLKLITEGRIPKGNVLEAARFAACLAVKKTPTLIPLCHPIPIEYVSVGFKLEKNSIKITVKVKGLAKTGVEMEAFTAASIAALTIYDMCKSLDRGMVISQIKLLRKSGGKSGLWER